MKADLVSDVVFQLVELAISMAETHLDGEELEDTLHDIAYKAEDAL